VLRLILIVIVVAVVLALLVRRKQAPPPLLDEIRPCPRSGDPRAGLGAGDEIQDVSDSGQEDVSNREQRPGQ
jgi:hypothetical protein